VKCLTPASEARATNALAFVVEFTLDRAPVEP
jgi:hypothetical protein